MLATPESTPDPRACGLPEFVGGGEPVDTASAVVHQLAPGFREQLVMHQQSAAKRYERGQVSRACHNPESRTVKFDGEICGGVLVENASDDFPQQKKLENLLQNFAGSSPPISPKTSPTSLWKSLVRFENPPQPMRGTGVHLLIWEHLLDLRETLRRAKARGRMGRTKALLQERDLGPRSQATEEHQDSQGYARQDISAPKKKKI